MTGSALHLGESSKHVRPLPRFAPDGKFVLYSSDLTDYANMYLVEVGDFDDLLPQA